MNKCTITPFQHMMQFLAQSSVFVFICYSIVLIASEDISTTTPKSEPNPIKPVYNGVRQFVGFSAVLKCIISDKKATDITWTRKGAQIKGDERHTVIKSANSTSRSTSLKIKSIESGDYGPYECNANISGKLYSASIKLLNRKRGSVVRANPSTVKESLDSNASLRCFLPKHATSISWTKNDTQVKTDKRHEVLRSSTDKFRTTTLNIKSVEEADFGIYECSANVSGKIEFANVTLTEKKKGPLVKPFQDEYKEPLKANVTLRCHLSKTPTSMKWSKDGTPLKYDKRHKIAKFVLKSGKISAMSLTIEHLEADEFGFYECEAIIAEKRHSAKIKLVEKKTEMNEARIQRML